MIDLLVLTSIANFAYLTMIFIKTFDNKDKGDKDKGDKNNV